MKSSFAVNLGMAIAGVLLAGTAFAQAPGGGGPGMGFGDHRPPMERSMGAQGEHGHWWNNPTVAERLKLTDTQRKAMDDTLQQHRETLVDLRGSLEKSELELEPMMKEDQPNESQILAQIDKVAQARAELEKANARFLLAIRSKLTPEQWKQMQADRASRPHGAWSRDGQGPDGQGRGQWQPGGRRGQGTPPAADGQGAPPPPAGPQSRMDGGAAPDGPPPAQDGADALQ
jgi:Spy/CpxP family protein refolding chaperone